MRMIALQRSQTLKLLFSETVLDDLQSKIRAKYNYKITVKSHKHNSLFRPKDSSGANVILFNFQLLIKN